MSESEKIEDAQQPETGPETTEIKDAGMPEQSEDVKDAGVPEPVNEVKDAEELIPVAATPFIRPHKDETSKGLIAAITFVVLILLLATLNVGFNWDDSSDDDDSPGEGPGGSSIHWNEPVWLTRDVVDEGNGQDYPEGVIGYEPSIAVDGQGNLYFTAHKDLRWCGPNGGPLGVPPGPGPFAGVTGFDTTWDYYASWFFVSQDGGETWGPPNDWGPANIGSELPGDEGDIGVDAMDRIFFADTTLEDDWLHIWTDGGDNYVNGQRLQSMTADDRPWIDAQGDGIVHFLGNNGVPVPGIPLSPGTSGVGRYWYYRGIMDPTDTYVVFDQGRVLEGGWAHIAAEQYGDHVYIAQEAANGGGGAVKVWVSDDTGLTWKDPVEVGPLSGSHPEGYPWMGIGENGSVYVAWQESPQGGRAVGTLNFAMSSDYGENWEYWDITSGYPVKEGGVYLYPNIEVGPGNVVAYTFYANVGTHTAGDEWHLYAGALRDPQVGDIFQFQQADPFPLHTTTQEEEDTDDLHPLHDLFEVAVNPVDLSINIAYQYNIGEHPFEPGEEQRYLIFVKGEWVDE